ncbi:Hypothetical predicted protein [Octopus vulgaris]|uniref:Uncharacterized protein n=1 Tax=Octopus vulgaris TaxID=6645 RepID=A0AA36EYH5_OCTVU|nr:Hypothetical predicted protein [Octopus vulgaris]
MSLFNTCDIPHNEFKVYVVFVEMLKGNTMLLMYKNSAFLPREKDIARYLIMEIREVNDNSYHMSNHNEVMSKMFIRHTTKQNRINRSEH